MKKIILLAFIVGMSFVWSCKKDKTMEPGFDFTGCKLVSSQRPSGSKIWYKESVTYSKNFPARLDYLVSGGEIIQGNYLVFRFENGQLAETEEYYGNKLLGKKLYTFSNTGRLLNLKCTSPADNYEQRVNISFKYDLDGNCDYLINEVINLTGSKVDNTTTDSILFLNYNSFGRPLLKQQYHAFTFGVGRGPYKVGNGYEYEYDAKGNRTKITEINYQQGKKYLLFSGEFLSGYEVNKELAEYNYTLELAKYYATGFSEVPFKDGGDKNFITKATNYYDEGKANWVDTTFYQFDANNVLISKSLISNQNPFATDTVVTKYLYTCK